MKQLKKRACKICQTEFIPFSSLTKVCSTQCSWEYVKQENLRKARKELKAEEKAYKQETLRRKRKFNDKDRSGLLKKAQTAFNAYIRERDKNEPCISCGTSKNVQYCAGHFKTRGSHPELRFNELNCHKQCNNHCNMHLSGNIQGYRPRLIDKIGLDKVLWLEGLQEAQNWSLDDIKEITIYYKDKLKGLENGI